MFGGALALCLFRRFGSLFATIVWRIRLRYIPPAIGTVHCQFRERCTTTAHWICCPMGWTAILTTSPESIAIGKLLLPATLPNPQCCQHTRGVGIAVAWDKSGLVFLSCGAAHPLRRSTVGAALSICMAGHLHTRPPPSSMWECIGSSCTISGRDEFQLFT